MSAAAVDWALTQDLGASKKLLLVTIAWVSDDAGTTYKSQTTIAKRLGKDPRWVREHLPALAKSGRLTRYRRHRASGKRTSDLIVLNYPREEPLDLSIYSGVIGEKEPADQDPTGVIPPQAATGENPPVGLPAKTRRATGENPPTNKPLTPPSSLKEEGREAKVPEGFPQELRPHARMVMKVLREAAAARGANEITAQGVGRAVMDNPRKALVSTALELRAWLLDGNGRGKPCKDVLSRYRNWLRDAPNLAVTESLDDDGHPTSPGLPNVMPLRPGGRGGAERRTFANAGDPERFNKPPRQVSR